MLHNARNSHFIFLLYFLINTNPKRITSPIFLSLYAVSWDTLSTMGHLNLVMKNLNLMMKDNKLVVRDMEQLRNKKPMTRKPKCGM
jgi:hypothetical protein